MKKLITTIVLTALLLPAMAKDDDLPSQIRVETKPAGALVYCDGTLHGGSPALIPDLPPGDHIIIAEMDGYRSARETINVITGQRSTIQLELEQLSALAIIHTEPSGAEVEIEGVSRGTTPLLLTDLTPGKHRVKLTVQGFQPKEVELNAPDRTPVKLSVSLNSDSARLVINSRPTSAEVILNGIAKGTTPVTLDRIPAGNVTLEIKAPGCTPYKQILTLAAGQSETITAVLGAIPSTLEVVSMPDGARIYVDNQFKGETPVTITDLPPGTYRVRAEKRGYTLSAPREVGLKRAEKVTEEFRLTKNAGGMEITTEPAGIKVFVDGEDLGTTKANAQASDAVSDPLVIDLLGIGEHTVQLTRPGYFRKEFDITVEKNKTVAEHHKLRRMFIKNYTVRTSDATYEGMFLGETPVGGVKIEIRPGIVKTLSVVDIISHGPIRQNDVDNP